MKSSKIIPYAIVAVLVAFAGYIGHFVYRSTQANVSLVSEDYYQQEIQFQDVYEERLNSVDMNLKVEVTVIDYQLKVAFEELKHEGGTLRFFRPDDPGLDEEKVLPRTAQSAYDLSVMKRGLWFYELRYSVNGTEYLKEARFLLE
jgi:hypothetical protein